MKLILHAYEGLCSEEQMAMDEWMLKAFGYQQSYHMRLYSMKETYSIGRIQKYASLNGVFEQNSSYKIVRRPTGGGLVQHDDDFVISFVIPSGETLYDLKVIDLYAYLHQLFSEVLESLQIESYLNPNCGDSKPSVCFESPTKFDILRKGSTEKIVGSAIKKTKEGLLVQSSFNCGLKKRNFSRLFLDRLIEKCQFFESVEKSDRFNDQLESWKALSEHYKSQAWREKL